jgi:hypothetical protein
MKEKFSLSLTITITLFFSLTLWVFGPAHIFFPNSLEFSFSFGTIAPYLLALAACTMLVTTGIIFLLRKACFRQSISLLFTLSLLLWIQGNLLVWNYGPLDGREIHWNKMLKQGLIDGGLWIVLIAFALIKSKFFFKIARTAALAFIMIQTASVVMDYVKAPEIPSFKRYYIDETTKFSFSEKKNTIILMLDTYQSDIFQEIINEDENYKKIFRGFTYFRNNLAVFPKTYLSVPSFLTGCVYDNSIPVQDFLKKAYNSGTSLPKILKEQGYRVELYPYPHAENTIYFDQNIASNIKKRERGMLSGEDLALMLDISIFRQVPHIVKKHVYNNQEWFLKRLFSTPAPSVSAVKSKLEKEALRLFDIRFIDQMTGESSAKGETPVFKYYHLNGLHRPLVLNEKLEVRQMPYTERSSFKTQGKACLEIVRLFLEKLKSIGQFDNTTIVVLGDHGCADYPYGVKVEAAGLKPSEPQGKKIPSHIKAAGIPLVLIKPGEAKDEELKITDAPVSLKDISPTILAVLEIKGTQDIGESMFEIPETEQRERHFYYYNWSGWENDYLYSLREYAVKGHAWLDESWKEIGVVRAANAKIPYEYGTEIRFGRGGNSVRYLGIGWHAGQKDGFTWTREKKAELYFYLKPSQGDLNLKMFFKPFIVPGKLNSQELHIYVDGREIRKLVLTDPEAREYNIVIPKESLKGKELNIVLDIPTAVSPADLNISPDVRNLGIAVKTVILEEKNKNK